MEPKTPDDRMDLGGFMQNFVMSNPFKDFPGIEGNDELKDTPDINFALKPENPSPPRPNGIISATSSPSSNHSNKNNGNDINSDGSEELAVTDQTMDPHKAHYGSNVHFAVALKHQIVSGNHTEVQEWLKENYIHAPDYQTLYPAETILEKIHKKFSNSSLNLRSLHNIMKFTFPDSPLTYSYKIQKGSRTACYPGIVAQPETKDLGDLDLLKALAHRKLNYGTIAAAANLYHVHESSVASLFYWYPELGDMFQHEDIATQYEGIKQKMMILKAGAQRKRAKGSLSPRDKSKTLENPSGSEKRSADMAKLRSSPRPKRQKTPVDYRDPDSSSDQESGTADLEEIQDSGDTNSNPVCDYVVVKPEPSETELDNASTETPGIKYPLLKKLIKIVQEPRPDQALTDTLGSPVMVKLEPLDSGYNEENLPVQTESRKSRQPKTTIDLCDLESDQVSGTAHRDIQDSCDTNSKHHYSIVQSEQGEMEYRGDSTESPANKYPLLKKLIKVGNKPTVQAAANTLGSLVMVKSEPVDTGYDEENSIVESVSGVQDRGLQMPLSLSSVNSALETNNKHLVSLLKLKRNPQVQSSRKSKNKCNSNVDDIFQSESEQVTNSLQYSQYHNSYANNTTDNDTVNQLRSQINGLIGRVKLQEAQNHKLEVELLLSQNEVSDLKSVIDTQEVTFAELAQDFNSLQSQFTQLSHKFKSAWETLERDKAKATSLESFVQDPPGIRRNNNYRHNGPQS